MYNEDIGGAFCRVCKQTAADSSTQHTGGVWVVKSFRNWKKAVEKMKAHERSGLCIRASQALLVMSQEGLVMQQLQRMDMLEREKNRAAVKCLAHCTHFLTHHHIAHSTNFTELVDLVVFCGGREFQVFLESAPKNVVYISGGQ